MYATYYHRAFPAGHDMAGVRAQVVQIGPSLDDLRGLGLKAYLLRDNVVSSFYLWHDPVAMAEFFFGPTGGFAELVRNTGPRAVDHWLGVAIAAGPARDARPRTASLRATALPANLDQELAALTELGDRADVHTAALVADPKDFRLLRFVLWAEEAPADQGETFEVMYLSAPDIDQLRGLTNVRDAV